MTSFTSIPMIFCVSRCLDSTKPCSIGLHGVPNLWPMPSSEAYSAIRAFLNSGPLSLLTKVGIVPLLKMHSANILLASVALHFGLLAMSSPWHKQQMYVMVYTHPALSAGLLGPSRSIMTSSQQSLFVGTTGTASCF